MSLHRAILMVLAAAIATPASADLIRIDEAGSFLINPVSFPTLLGSDAPLLRTEDLATLHWNLASWDIDTDGKVTILAAETQAGLSMLVLVDREFGGGDSGTDGLLGMTTTGASSLLAFINDDTGDTWTLVQPPFGSQVVGATLTWGSLDSGDGFAWGNLARGDAVSFLFDDLADGQGGLDEVPFQFVDWDNDLGWSVVATSTFKVTGDYAFTGTVIPAPPAAALLLAGLLAARRRRRA